MSKEEVARKIFGERAAFYTTSGCHTDPVVLQRVVELARPDPGDRVLDIGTGTGHTALALAPRAGLTVGLDLTLAMLQEAEQLQLDQGLANVCWVQSDGLGLPFPADCFPVVTCRRTAHHFSDITRAIAEMWRVGAPGGRLVIDDRSVPEDDGLDALLNELDLYHDRSHVRQYRPSEWREMLGGAGYQVDAVEPYRRHRPLSSLTRGVCPEDVARIHERLGQVDEAQRQELRMATRDGELHFDHFYVTVAASKP